MTTHFLEASLISADSRWSICQLEVHIVGLRDHVDQCDPLSKRVFRSLSLIRSVLFSSLMMDNVFLKVVTNNQLLINEVPQHFAIIGIASYILMVVALLDCIIPSHRSFVSRGRSSEVTILTGLAYAYMGVVRTSKASAWSMLSQSMRIF